MKREAKIKKVKEWMEKNFPTKKEKDFPDIHRKTKRKAVLEKYMWMMETNEPKAMVIDQWRFLDTNESYIRFGYYILDRKGERVMWGSQYPLIVMEKDIKTLFMNAKDEGLLGFENFH